MRQWRGKRREYWSCVVRGWGESIPLPKCKEILAVCDCRESEEGEDEHGLAEESYDIYLEKRDDDADYPPPLRSFISWWPTLFSGGKLTVTQEGAWTASWVYAGTTCMHASATSGPAAVRALAEAMVVEAEIREGQYRKRLDHVLGRAA